MEDVLLVQGIPSLPYYKTMNAMRFLFIIFMSTPDAFGLWIGIRPSTPCLPLKPL